MNRKQQKAARHRRQEHRNRHREARVERVFEAFGAGKLFRSLGKADRHEYVRSRYPEPDVAADPSLMTGADRLLASVRDTLNATTLTVNDTELHWPDAYSVIMPQGYRLRTSPGLDRKTGRRDESRAVFARLERALLGALDEAVHRVTGGASELDRVLYWYRTETDPRGRLRIVVGEERPQSVVVDVDGKPRTAYRCGGGRGSRGFEWTVWPAEVLATGPNGPPTTVYIQAHALDRLRERVPVPHVDLHLSLLDSLAAPVVATQDGNSVFVKFVHLGGFHIGHLVARRVPHGALVTTFLFLTMQGTPESHRLRAALRLRRPDVEYTGLDDLHSFINSDLADDPELAEVFRTCGCGDLLRLCSDEAPCRAPLRASALRRYLGT